MSLLGTVPGCNHYRLIQFRSPRRAGTVLRRDRRHAAAVDAGAETQEKGAPMPRTVRRRPPRVLLLVVAAGAAALTIRRRRQQAQARDDDRPADLGFMRAIHAGLRRDAARLQALAPQLDHGNGRPGAAPKGWTTFRQTLQVHHAAEDDALWPVLRDHLTQAEDLHQLDLMVAEHRSLTAAIQAVDAALTGGVGVTTAARELGGVL